MKKIAATGSLLFFVPLVASAQALRPLIDIVNSIGGIINLLIPILIALALVVFFWGLIQYIRKPEIKEGKNVMIAGLISLFIMVSVWGIILLAQGALGVNASKKTETAPRVLPGGYEYL